MPATRPPTSEAVPVMVTVGPWMTLLPPDGEVITAVGEVWSLEAWASTRLACRVPGWTPISANRLTMDCCTAALTGAVRPLVIVESRKGAYWFDKPQDHMTVPAPKTKAPLVVSR